MVIKRKVTTKKQSDEDKILGVPIVQEVVSMVDYENKNVQYKVTNLEVKNSPIFVRGNLIETFIGAKNAQARSDLKKGEKEVICKDIYGKNLYKIEVIE